MPPNLTTTPRSSRMVLTTTTTPTSGRQRAKKETLHYLAVSSSTTAVDAARTLLEKGANVSAIDRDGATPLHYACANDNVAMAQLLLTFGADPMSTDKLGRTAYSIAKGNTLRFLRRYRKKDHRQRLGFFRRFFACHTRNETFFIVRQRNQMPDALAPTALAEAASTSFTRGNALTKSYRNAKKKIRATFHALRRSRSNSNLEDVVLTSEGFRKVSTPSRTAQKQRATPKRSMSVSDLPSNVPTRRTIREQDQKTKTTRRGRSKTPDVLPTQKPTVQKAQRSRSQENEPPQTRLMAMPAKDPMAYYNTTRARIAGLRPAPSAPPLSPDPPKTPKSRSKSPGVNTTTYYTADEESIELLGNDFKKLAVTPTTVKKKPKTPSSASSSSEDDPPEVLTPTTVDDGEMRKIRRLRDPELRCELRKFGISPAGALDARTRRLYEKKLLIERRKVSSRGYSPDTDVLTLKYSLPLELCLKAGSLPPDLHNRAKRCDDAVREQFSGDGFGSFCYLIMDPRILGTDVDKITLRTFVRSIFYVGKGSKNRPLAHFIDTRNEREKKSEKLKTNEKLMKIDELWTLGHGIPRHEFAHGVSDEEAFVREASVIEAIKLNNLSNKKAGEFHGAAKNWDSVTKAEYGSFILERALATLKLEGIRLITEEKLPEQIYPYVTNRRGATPRTPKTPK